MGHPADKRLHLKLLDLRSSIFDLGHVFYVRLLHMLDRVFLLYHNLALGLLLSG